MAWDEHAKKVAIKAIGTVESSMNYASINYNDPITVGIGQWYGPRAAAILCRMRDENAASWTGVENSINTDLRVRPSSSSWWTTRYLTRAEGNSLVPVLKANSPIQDDQIVKDLDAYVPVATNAGIDVENNTNTFIMFCVAYHQGPKYALQVVSAVGGQASLEQFRNGCLNNSVLGRYPSRYNTAYTIIKNGDTSGVGDLSGSSGVNTTPGNSGSTPNTISGSIKYIKKVGDGTLHLVTSNGTITAYPTVGEMWQIGGNDGGTIGAPQTGSNSDGTTITGGSELQNKIVQWCVDRIDKFKYSQGPQRLNPEASGYTDCSALIWRAYKDVAGIEIGTYTGTQKNNGVEVCRGSGTMSDTDMQKLQPADLIVMQWSGGGEHVELSMGGDRHIGHGGPDDGPDIQGPIQTYLTRTAWWTVRRIVT